MMEGKTQIIAHRGYWQTEPPTAENSLQALENAQKLDIDGTEFDIRMSKDGVLIIYHDEHYESREISETQFSDLKKFKLKNDERIPTLKEYLEKGKEIPTLKLMLELKPLKSKVKESELVQKAIQLVNELHLGSQCEFISFSLNICEQLKKEKSTLKVHYLNGNLSPLEINEKGLIVTNIDGSTTKKGVFSGGDVVTGAKTVVEAVKMSKIIAEKMDEYMRNEYK